MLNETGIDVLELSIYTHDATDFYKIHCRATGAYVANNYNRDLFFATVLINPNTGKLVDIEYFNYYYDYIGGSNSMTFTRHTVLILNITIVIIMVKSL